MSLFCKRWWRYIINLALSKWIDPLCWLLTLVPFCTFAAPCSWLHDFPFYPQHLVPLLLEILSRSLSLCTTSNGAMQCVAFFNKIRKRKKKIINNINEERRVWVRLAALVEIDTGKHRTALLFWVPHHTKEIVKLKKGKHLKKKNQKDKKWWRKEKVTSVRRERFDAQVTTWQNWHFWIIWTCKLGGAK